MRKPILAVIAGGGCRQIECATGLIQAIESIEGHFDCYMGSSAGAAVAALHASGLNGDDLEALIRNTPARQLFRPCRRCQLKSLVPWWSANHLLHADGMYAMLKENMTEAAREIVQVAVTRRRDYTAMMCPANPTTVMASAAIPEVFPPVMIGEEEFIDGGVKNIVPTPKIAELRHYRHIYILLCNDDVPGRRPRTRIGRAIQAFYRIMDREYCQLYESGWHELPQVTLLHPPPFASGLLEWSKEYGLIQHAREYALKVMEFR